VSLLAAIGSTGYNVMLLLHVLAVIIGFAPAWLTPAMMRLTAAGDREAADQLETSILRYSLPGIAVAGLLGFGLAGMSDEVFKLSQPWLMASVLLWLILLAVIVFLARPAVKAFRDGDAKARGMVSASTGISHLILLVMLYLMIFKPGL
jgi:uncharacterized membrane protein